MGRNDKTFGTLFTSRSEDYSTPQDFFDELNKEFDFQVDPCASRDGACLVYTGPTSGKGYGAVSYGGRTEFAHRFSWMLKKGPIPKGLWVLHRCDNPPCVNIRHLFLGSAKDNTRDAIKKKRLNPHHTTNRRRGELNHRAHLTERKVEIIRRWNYRCPKTVVARRLGVSISAVWSASVGRTWGWLKTNHRMNKSPISAS